MARALHSTLTSSLHTASTASSRSFNSVYHSALTSLSRASVLPTLRHFADAARSQQPTTRLPSSSSSSPPDDSNTATSSDSHETDTLTSTTDARTGDIKRSPVKMSSSEQKAAERRAKLLARAKEHDRVLREREKAVNKRMKAAQQRIIESEKARERAALTKQRRQETKDELRAKAAEEKQQQAEAKLVMAQYKEQLAKKPKRPMSPFVAYAQSIRTSLPASDVTETPVEFSRRLGAVWRGMSEGERQKWEARYQTEMPEYRQRIAQWKAEQQKFRPPKRPLNAYARYVTQRVKEIREAEGGGKKASVLMKRIAAEWKDIPNEDKEKMSSERANDSANYQQRKKEWEEGSAAEVAMWRVHRSSLQKEKDRKVLRRVGRKEKEPQADSTVQ